MDNREESLKKAHILCYISLACMYGVPMLMSLIGFIITPINSEAFTDAITASMGLIGMITPLFPIAGFVLMICARVICPTCKFAKVLMWVYIVQLVVAIIMVIAVIAIFAIVCNDCLTDCQNMGLWNTLLILLRQV